MLSNLLDLPGLTAFISRLASASRLRIELFDADGAPLTASPPMSEFRAILGPATRPLPSLAHWQKAFDANGADHVEFLSLDGVWSGVVPIRITDEPAALALIGDFAGDEPPLSRLRQLASERNVAVERLHKAWELLPRRDAPHDERVVAAVLDAARLVESWCGRDYANRVMRDEVLLMARIAELMTGDADLQSILDQIVAETARVMACKSASLRLLDRETGELTIQAVHNLPERYLHKGRVLRGENPIDDAALRGEVVYVEDARKDPRVRFKDAARREGIVSGLSAGMIYRGRPVGVLRVYTDRPMRFRRVQREMLRAIGSQAAAAIVHNELMRQRLLDAEMNRQLALAGEVQTRMVPQSSPRHDRIEIATVYECTYLVGGDFWDHFMLPDGRTAFVIADVFGKGIPASLVMASVRAALRAHRRFSSDLGEIVTRLNRGVIQAIGKPEFVTMTLIAINADATELGMCCAGHEPALLLRNGELHRLTHGGLVLGADIDERFEEHRLPLQRGDFLLLYTDGVVEAADFSGKLFGRKRLRDSLVQYGGDKPSQTLQSILWDIRRFVGLADQSDDLTMVGLRVK